jgi:2-C-methyl-D-erythritol 4-phosphate cytidylyltransferase
MNAIDAPRCYALVPCAGVGVRSGAGLPKQYVQIAGRAMVAHTLSALGAVGRIAGTLVVLASDDDRFESEVPSFAGDRRWVARCGGATRAHSVAHGLGELVARGARPGDWVLVHDAARCLIRPEWVDRLIDGCLDDAVGGLLALPLADTLKSEQEGRVGATLARAGKWAAQTPQMFRIALLQQALAQANGDVTDEASAIEQLGHAPRLVVGALENFKLTVADDFDLARRLLETRA